MFNNTFPKITSDKNLKLAIIKARFNHEITNGLLTGCQKTLAESGILIENIDIFEVPGSFEIPLIAKKAYKTGKYDAIICLGAIIRGDTAHFDYVCKAVTEGILEVNLKYESDTPVIFGIITTENYDQAVSRSSGDEKNKGSESALTALEMISLIKSRF